MGLLLYFLHDASAGHARTRALAEDALDLAMQLVAAAPLLGGILGPVDALLRRAGLA
jgi:hypothetical protein